MKLMPIVWKRLVKGGETCTRCGNTGRELEAAVTKLAAALRPLGIEPVLETREIDEDAFKERTSESNRVWIADTPIEELIGADVGMSRCCSVCGDSDCRTLEVKGHQYETIPEEQFIKAGLIAASQMIATGSPPEQAAKLCCGSSQIASNPLTQQRAKSGCCDN